jgi:hypothetical protein
LALTRLALELRCTAEAAQASFTLRFYRAQSMRIRRHWPMGRDIQFATVLNLRCVPVPVLEARIGRFIPDGGKGSYPDIE